MERLEKLVNILKLTPHRQPELVKEATHRILSRQLKSDPQISHLLKPLLEILIQYCDDDDSAQRSLFNDHLNSVVLTFQNQYYQLIFRVFLDEVTRNGSVRTITAALQRIPCLVCNVQPTELGCEPQKLLKSFIEVARRSEDESIQRALDLTLKHVMPYLDYHVRKSKEVNFLTNLLVDTLMRNLQNESSQIKRLAASSIANICHSSEVQYQSTLAKLRSQLESLSASSDSSMTDSFVGFCLCVRELQKFAEHHHDEIISAILKQVDLNSDNHTLMNASLEALKELFGYKVDVGLLLDGSRLIAERFLISDRDGQKVMKEDIKVTLQANALACFTSIVKQQPKILDQYETVFMFKNHEDVAVRNQLIIIMANYIEASWRFPYCVDHSIDCERIRKLWIEFRGIICDCTSHPDTLKSCIIAIRSCINTLLESDHCLHIVEYQDIDQIINLYLRTNFKPLKIEILNLFASVNYRTLHYLERSHWSKMRAQVTGSFIHSLQDRIVNNIMIDSLIDEHQRVRAAATSALISIIPNLYITSTNNGARNISHRYSDPIVSLANNLASEHLVVLEQEGELGKQTSISEEPISSDLLWTLNVRNEHKLLSSSIIPSYDESRNQNCIVRSQSKINISINLMYAIGLLKLFIETNLEKGKVAISSIVRAFHELALAYPVIQYPTSWDCRPSEYCECFTLLNFLLTYLENLNEPDVVVEDLEAYRNFLALSHQLLFALCHESVQSDYEHQKMKPLHKRQADFRDGYWPDLTIKHPYLADTLQVYFTHLTKLLWLISYIIEEKSNPFASSKQPGSQQQKASTPESLVSHDTLTSNRLLFGRVHKKLESSFKSSKKNLNQKNEKFYQVLETCISSISSLLEFIGMSKSIEQVKGIISYLKVISSTCGVSTLICARQLLKSLFGVNILALYQVDPNDWFEEESLSPSSSMKTSQQENTAASMQGVYYHLISDPYQAFSNYYSMNCSITPTSDKALANMNFDSRRALKVRRRIEGRVKSLFEFNPNLPVPPRVRQISEDLKNTITEFTPIVTDCMNKFFLEGFVGYQCEALHLMSYLILLRVNYQKLPLAQDFISSITKLLDYCGDKVFSSREHGISNFLRNSFTFLTLLTYERGPSKPMFLVPAVIQRLDDLRAKLSMSSDCEQDVGIYVVPLLRCLVEDLFIYRTKQFQNPIKEPEAPVEGDPTERAEQYKRDVYEILEAERETVAQKLLDVIDNPEVYDLLSSLILESRQNSSEIKYKKLSQHLLSIIPNMLSERDIDLTSYRRIELTRRIIENISPEVFQPVNFIFETLLVAPKPPIDADLTYKKEFERWMSQVLIAMHILTTQVREEVFVSRLRETMTDEDFVNYLLHIAQLCIAEITIQLFDSDQNKQSSINFLIQQTSCYILYLAHMFQSGLFFQLSRSAVELVKREIKRDTRGPRAFSELCNWARDPNNGFCLNACEEMFFHIKLIFPDLTIFWSNVMMLLNNVDCNRDYWRNLLVYECHQCQFYNIDKSLCSLVLSPSTDDGDTTSEMASTETKNEASFKRGPHINRPSSLNLSDISFSDQLRRSFIKKIAATETRDKALNRNIIETSDEDGQPLEREVSIGNTEQCLSPNIELTRRGVLCLVLDFVTISMNDVEHITWLIIHHINDIVRWSHELPITEFINAVHGNSASSGIFIQAINNGFNNFTSISLVTRLIWTLEQVHYTQYGSLIVLLVEKLLSSPQLMPYRSLTKSIEDFACVTVQKLLNETNKSLITTNDEVVNQLTAEDLDKIVSMLDADLYPNLTKLLTELRESARGQNEQPTIEFHMANQDSDEDSESDEVETLYSKSNLIFWLAEQNCTANISSLMPALNRLKVCLAEPSVVEKLNQDEVLVSFLITAIYSLALNTLPPPTRLVKPKFWTTQGDVQGVDSKEFSFEQHQQQQQPPAPVTVPLNKPTMLIGSRRPLVKPVWDRRPIMSRDGSGRSEAELVETVRSACLKGLFLLENLEFLGTTQFEFLHDLIVRLARLPLVNSFVLTPPALWRQNVWPTKFNETDLSKTKFPMVTHDILLRDHNVLENYCDRLLKLGWTSRRQFEEAWMTLLGVLSSTLSQPEPAATTSPTKDAFGAPEAETRRANLLTSCKVITTLTRLLLMTRKGVMGDPLSADLYPVQGFDERIMELTKAIGTNLSALRKKTQGIFESLESDRGFKSKAISSESPSSPKTLASEGIQHSTFTHYLKMPAQKLRMNSILNLEMGMQDTVIIDSESGSDNLRNEEVDCESCIRLLLSIYKQKIKDPNENLCSISPSGDSIASQPAQQRQQVQPQQQQQQQQQQSRQASKGRPVQLAPPLTTGISQSVLALSDMFTEYEQFDWLFETFVQMFRLAERNEDELQMQYLILGLSKAAAVCCYEIPNELTTSATSNHRDVMFEKCRQSIEKSVKSEFIPLRVNALFAAYYLLEDSINIVSSGAWELDQFKRLRQSRLAWILKLAPILLDRENGKLLTKRPLIIKLLETLCETVTESELKAIKI